MGTRLCRIGLEHRPGLLLLRVEQAVGHGPARLGVEHVGEALGGRAEDDDLVAVAVVVDVVLLLDRPLRDRGVGDGDEGVELGGAGHVLAAAPRDHDLAGADVDAHRVRAALHQVLDLAPGPPPATSRGGPCSPPFGYPPLAARAALAAGRLFRPLRVPRLLVEPAVVGPHPLAAARRPPSGPRPRRPSSSCRSASRTPGHGSPMTARNCSSYPKPNSATAGEARRYRSGRPKASKGKPRAQSTWWPIRCFRELTLVEPVGHAHLRRDRPLVAQVVGQAAPRLELRPRDGQRAAALPARLEARPRSWVRSGSGRRGRPALQIDMPAWFALSCFLHHAEDLAEAVDQVVVDVVAVCR